MAYHFDATFSKRTGVNPKLFMAPKPSGGERHLHRLVRWVAWLGDQSLATWLRENAEGMSWSTFYASVRVKPRPSDLFLRRFRDYLNAYFGGDVVTFEDLERLSQREVTYQGDFYWVGVAAQILKNLHGEEVR